MANRQKRGSTKKTSTRARGRGGTRGRFGLGTDVQTSYFFMLNCLLHSRVHTGIESNSEFYDEDVNVYLAHLLNAHVDPRYIARNASCIALGDADLRRMLGDTCDDRQRFRLYKANADYLLMAVTVFDLFEEHRYNRSLAFQISRETYIGRASTYYALASSYASKLRRSTNALSEVFRKLSEGIDSYVKILSFLRGEYLDFIRRYSQGELFHLDRAIEEIEKSEAIEKMRNDFLDTYQAWLTSGDQELRERLAEQAALLKEIDPTFEFKPPK